MEITNNETKNNLINNNNLKFDLSYFYNLDYENKICFDCGGPSPCCASINNGVFLCKFCGENHKKKLNYNISFIHYINDEWDQYLLSFVTRGGNSRFKRLCQEYEVPCQSLSQNDDEKINKYIIRLGEYQRLVLKSEINCEEPPPILYHEVAKEPISNPNAPYFPEFENYKLFKGNNYSNSSNNSNKNKNLNYNADNTSVGSKIWEGTKTTFNVMKTTTGIIYNTGKPIVSFLGNAAFSGLKLVGTSVWNYMNNNNETNNEEENTTIGKYDNNYNQNLQINERNNNVTLYPSQNKNYNNNYNFNQNNIINNRNIQNKNYLTNSNRYNIFSINENGLQNNKDNKNNLINKKMPKNRPNYNDNNISNNNILNYYDINSINNESVNNITFYLNNNNSIDSISKISNDYKRKNSLLKHENIIVNDKYINTNNVFIYNDKKEKNDLNGNNALLPNNNYPSFNNTFRNEENNNSIINREIIDKNMPNIIGEEINQEKARYPIYQSQNLLNDNSFLPTEYEKGKENNIDTPNN